MKENIKKQEDLVMRTIKGGIILGLFFIISCTNSSNELMVKNNDIEDSYIADIVQNIENDIDLIPLKDTIDKGVKDESFIEYFNKIPILETGYKATCYNTNFETIKIESDFSPSQAPILGKLLPISNDYYFIVYVYAADIPLPILEIYNVKGEKVKEFQLFNYGFCTDLLFDNQSSSFEVLSNERIVITSFLENSDSLEIVQADTINLVNEISLLDN